MILAGDRGPKVLALQQALLERGMLPPGIEDEQQLAFFGPVTLGAVKTFQAKAGLVVDGVVGPRTWGALQKVGSLEKDEAQAPDYGRMSKLAARAVATADAELQRAVREHPMGSNRGHDVDGYLRGIYDDAPYLLKYAPDKAAPGGWGGAPWCGRAARWCFERGAQQLGQPSPFLSWKSDLASALKWRDAAAERGVLRAAPWPGYVGLILIEVPGAQPHGHVVMIAAINGIDGADGVVTREANSGNRWAARWRSKSEFTGGFVDVG